MISDNTTTYDVAGRLKTVTNPLGQITTFGYDAASQQTTRLDARGVLTTYAYTDVGHLKK